MINSFSRSLFLILLLGGVVWFGSAPISQSRAQTTAPTNDEAGFEPIFDGQTLKGWEGDTQYWRVENGALVGEITADKPLKQNTFIIWRGGQPRDFELKVDYRISEIGNSGINYRSEEVPGLKWALRGYQADIDGKNRYTGQNYEERGRAFLAMRGQVARLTEGQKPIILGSVGQSEALQSLLKPEWNEFHLIARGNTMIHLINGQVMCVVIDEDTKKSRAAGWLGMQVHTGPPMKVEYRNIRLKQLTPQAATSD